jgi:chitooligosaccharide deacetylase
MGIVIAIVAGLLAFGQVAPFPFLLDATARDVVVWRMPPRQDPPAVYLTFDDGPNPTATPRVLDALARHRAKATFFLIGKHVTVETAPIVRRMFSEGHGVALHSDNRWLMLETPDQLALHLDALAGDVERLAGTRPCRAFRPHAGARSPSMFQGLRRIEHRLIGWGFLGWDWNWFRRPTADAIVPRLTRRASDGFIFVVHDGHHVDPRAPRGYAADTVDRLVPALRDRGFELRSICEDLRDADAPAR